MIIGALEGSRTHLISVLEAPSPPRALTQILLIIYHLR